MEWMGRQKIETSYICIFRPLRYHALAQWLNVRLHKFTCIAVNQVCQDVIVAPCKKGKTVAKRCEHVDLPRNFNSWQKSVVPNKRMHVHPKSGLPRFDYSPSCQGLADWAISNLKIQSLADPKMVKPDLRRFYARPSPQTPLHSSKHRARASSLQSWDFQRFNYLKKSYGTGLNATKGRVESMKWENCWEKLQNQRHWPETVNDLWRDSETSFWTGSPPREPGTPPSSERTASGSWNWDNKAAGFASASRI